MKCLIVVAFFVLMMRTGVRGYNIGEHVPMARQAQFHSMRTPWHDVLSRQCPRFAIPMETSLILPRPTGFTEQDTYKLLLSFGRERFVTPWLLIINKAYDRVPIVNVKLTYFGTELRGVNTKVTSMPSEYIATHRELIDQYFNTTHWPKHVLVRYTWEEQKDVDLNAGLVLLFAAGLLLSNLMAIYIMQSSKEKISKFINEQIIESPAEGEVAKVD